jgi:hypothetical protein
MHPVAVKQPGLLLRQVAVPDEIGLLRHDDALDFTPAMRVEQAQLDLCRMFREERKVNAVAIPRSAKGIGFAWPHLARGSDRWFIHFKGPIGLITLTVIAELALLDKITPG